MTLCPTLIRLMIDVSDDEFHKAVSRRIVYFDDMSGLQLYSKLIWNMQKLKVYHILWKNFSYVSRT